MTLDTPPTPVLSWSRVLSAMPLLLSVIVFFPILGHGFLWDDFPLIVRNAWVQDVSFLGKLWTHDFWATQDASNALGGLGGRYYRPIVTSAFAFQWWAGGGKPWVFHAVSLGLHLLCTMLVQSFLRRRLPPGTWNSLVATLAACWFAIHPTRVESVSWISASTELWMALWVLLAWHVWDRFHETGLGFLSTFGLLVLGVCSKETAFVAPALWVLEAWALAPENRNKLKKSFGLWGLMALVAGVRMKFFPLGPQDGPGFFATVERVISSFGHYGRQALAWAPISVQDSETVWDDAGRMLTPVWALGIGLAFLTALILLSVAAWRKPAARAAFVDLAWCVFPLLPVANVLPLQMNVLVAARFWYLPWVGILALLVRLVAKASVRDFVKRWAVGGMLGVALSWAWVSSRHVPHFENEETLWTFETQTWPQHLLPQQFMQVMATRRGHLREAGDWAKKAMGWVWTKNPTLEWRIRSFLVSMHALLKAEVSLAYPRVANLRAFLEALFSGRPATLDVDGTTYQWQVPQQQLRALADATFTPYVVLAQARLDTGDLEGATWVMKTATARRPNVKDGWVFLAQLQGLAHNWEEAHLSLLRALPLLTAQERPSFVALFETCAQATHLPELAKALEMSRCQYAFSDLSRARKTLDEALEKYPQQVELWRARIELEFNVDNPQAAQALKEKARQTVSGTLFDVE